MNKRFEEYYEARMVTGKDAKGKTTNKKHEIWFDFVASYIDVILSSIDKTIPRANPVARSRDWIGAAEAMRDILRYVMVEAKFGDEVSWALLDALLRDEGGFTKIGYDSEFGLGTENKDVDGYRGGTKKGQTIEYSESVKRETPFLKRWPAEDFLHDTTVLEIQDGQWIAFRFWRPAEDLYQEPNYDQDVVKSISERYVAKKETKDRPVELFEIWNKKTRKVMVMSREGNHEWLLKPKKWPYDTDGFPVEQLKFFWRRKSPYGLSPIRFWIAALEAMCRVLANYAKKSDATVPKWGYMKGALDESGIQQLESNEQVAVEFQQEIATSLQALAHPSIPMDEMRTFDMLWNVVRNVSGVSEQQQGVQSMEGRETATSVIARQQSSMSRMGRMRSVFEKFWSRILRKTAQIIKQKYPQSKIIPILGENLTPEDWTEWKADYRKAEFDFVSIEVSSTAPMSIESQQQMFSQIAQSIPVLFVQLGQAATQLQQLGIEMNPEPLIRELLSAFPQIRSWRQVFPQVYSRQDPYWENSVMQNGGMAQVLPEDDDAKHIRVHWRLIQDLQMNPELAEGYVNAIVAAVHAHIQAHEAQLAATNVNSPGFGYGPQPGGNGGGAPTGAAPPSPEPQSLGGRANALMGQAAPQAAESPGNNQLNLAASGLKG